MAFITRRSAILAGAAGSLLLRGQDSAASDKILGAYGTAPEFSGISHWLNSPPLTMASLRGKIVLVDFWTYSCINCLRTLPYVTRWYNTYRELGLVVVGVHTPEFAFERNSSNVRTAMDRFGIHYPVAQDNSYATWQAFSNQFWPAEYLVDRNGQIVARHFGEGSYDEMENAIRGLLRAGPSVPADGGEDLSRIGSPEMYFGLARLEMLASPETPRAGEVSYSIPTSLARNHFALSGIWSLSPEAATLARDGGEVELNFRSGKVFMVANSPRPVAVSITVDGRRQPPVTVHESRLYILFDSVDYRDHVLSLFIPSAGFNAFTFTFG